MINEDLLSDDLWIPALGEQHPNKLIVTDKMLKRARNKYCSCIFCALKGEDKKNEELVEKIIIDYISTYIDHRNRTSDYIHPIDLLEILIKFIYNNDVPKHFFLYYPESNNLTPLMRALLNSGFSQTEMDRILDKFTYKHQNDSNWDNLPF